MKIYANLTRTSLLCAALLIWLGMACATFTRVAPAIDITGTWQADFNTPQGKFETFLKIQRVRNGILLATIDVPSMSARDIPVTFSYENGIVHWEIEAYEVSFNGKPIDSSTIEGTIVQVGREPGSAIYKRVE
ncbi:MAG: hypothetical protein JSU77_01470 [Fidelibacterota bacterium]|nr:MAG: hypothetical protein JSU77_01470 [Candidatus Neomarinimicrobiota bacterium]